MINCLSYAFYALLRRNIIGFQTVEYPYFPANEIHRRPSPATTDRGTPMLTHFVRMIRAWKRYNQSLSELNRLGDRELADIGISRSDIPRVAWNASHKF